MLTLVGAQTAKMGLCTENCMYLILGVNSHALQEPRQNQASKSITGFGFRDRQQMSRHLYLDEVQSSDNSLQGEVKS